MSRPRSPETELLNRPGTWICLTCGGRAFLGYSSCDCEQDEPEPAAWPKPTEDERLDSPTHNLSNFLNRGGR